MITAYHSSDQQDLAPRRFLHVGTIEQARMRGGRYIHVLEITPAGRVPRLIDRGDWRIRNLMRHAARAKLAVYLNRHEGIPLEEFERARTEANIDRIGDGAFRRLVPSARDSWIVLDPTVIVSVRILETEEPRQRKR